MNSIACAVAIRSWCSDRERFELPILRLPEAAPIDRTHKIGTEPSPCLAHPADTLGRHPRHQCMGRNITCHHGTCGNETVFPEHVATHNRGVGTDGCAAFDQRVLKFAFALDLRARVVDVGEHTRWPAEHTILQSYALIDGDIVLDFYVVADRHLWANHDVLANVAIAPDRHLPEDM